jgi:hypothetical protein
MSVSTIDSTMDTMIIVTQPAAPPSGLTSQFPKRIPGRLPAHGTSTPHPF